LFGQRQKIAAARKASRTPINGLETANQKETRQPDSLAVGFVFTLFSQAFEDRYFTKRECERYDTEDSNKHRHGKRRSDLAELIGNVMRKTG
jgi:hypothetical protein